VTDAPELKQDEEPDEAAQIAQRWFPSLPFNPDLTLNTRSRLASEIRLYGQRCADAMTETKPTWAELKAKTRREIEERAKPTPADTKQFTEYFELEAVGQRIGLVTCRMCGAVVLIGDASFDGPGKHIEHHGKMGDFDE
jgi:rubrerythrin